MAGRVAESHDALEARVQARTQELHQAREEMDQFFSMSLDLLCIADFEGRFRASIRHGKRCSAGRPQI